LLNITSLRDKSLDDLDNLPDPDALAEDIAENLVAALENFRTIVVGLEMKL
jgi:type I restriction enzyme M protein